MAAGLVVQERADRKRDTGNQVGAEQHLFHGRAAAQNLRQKGLNSQQIEQALETVYAPDENGESPELEAAAALVKAGVVKGDANGLLNPLSKITRAEIVTMVDRLVGHYAKEAGAFVDASDGALVIVVAENVKIVNAPAGTKIIVAEKATGLTVNGKSVSDDQTYIVPKTTTGSGSSSGVPCGASTTALPGRAPMAKR